MSNNKWNKNALGYGEKTNSSLNDGWNKNALKYDSKNDLENSGLSCLLYTSPSPRDKRQSRMPSSA